MKTLRSAFVGMALVAAGWLHARVDLLLVPPTTEVSGKPGTEFILYLNNPTEFNDVVKLPDPLIAEYAATGRHDRVRLRPADGSTDERKVAARTFVKVTLVLADEIRSEEKFVSLRLTEPVTNAMMFELLASATRDRAEEARTPFAAEWLRRVAPLVAGPHLDLATDVDNTRRHISAYDPIYFAIGWRERMNARFQLSFKYRVFEPGPRGEAWWKQAMRDFYMAYTQTSIWDLETFSKPFYDSSYKPTAFLLHEFKIDDYGRRRAWLQVGVQHESNGKGGGSAPVPSREGLLSPTLALRHPSDSRSVNSFYLVSKAKWSADDGFFAEASLRANAYMQADENPDLASFRGHFAVVLRAGMERGFQLAVDLRGSPRGHGSAEFNATWPAAKTPFLKKVLPETLGGYAQIQYFNGYGESLVDYDVRRKDQLRFGMMFVR